MNEPYVALYLAYPGVEGAAVQKIWLLTPRAAAALEATLGEALAELLLSPESVRAAGEAAIGKGAQMFTNHDEGDPRE